HRAITQLRNRGQLSETASASRRQLRLRPVASGCVRLRPWPSPREERSGHPIRAPASEFGDQNEDQTRPEEIQPPSTTTVAPLTNDAASEARNTATPAISAGRPRRGCVDRMRATRSSRV